MEDLQTTLLKTDLEKSVKIIQNDLNLLSSKINTGMSKIISSNLSYSQECKEETTTLLDQITSNEQSLVQIIKDCESMTEDIRKMELLSVNMFLSSFI